ncbi:MAG: F0F1 ATP synthase subunit epsilon [Nitrospinaceae bacterium]|jgi:F-type H+-transporting ATPase subunit epsilon|nr:F0F1 ATP synthase subunit epsilon [Nitrospinaceae bacterium]
MAENKMQLSIVTPERLVVNEDVDQVNVPGIEGDLGILYDHASILTTMRPGQLSYESDGEKGRETIHMVVSGGYLEVTDNRVIVLAETAEFLDQIDKERAKTALVKAEEVLADTDLSDEAFEKAQHKLFRAVARLENTEEN